MKISWQHGAVELDPSYGGQYRAAWLSPDLAAFAGLLLFIAAVSVHDAALVVVNHQVILDFEKNPFGRWLIEANGGGVWLFVTVKLFGTSLACAILAVVYEHRRRLGMAVAGAMAIFQAALLVYLCLF